MKRVINTPLAPKPVGPYSQAIEANGTLYVAGQIAIIPSSGEIAEGFTAQAHQVFKNIGEILREAGYSYDDVVKTTVLLDNIADSAEMSAIYATYFSAIPQPARSCFEVAKLPLGVLIEVEVIATK
ncbi:MAG: Rid family detoxifying hydrolase [Rikenellaceae bacterium]